VKSIFGNSEVPKIAIFDTFEALKLDFENFLQLLKAEILPKTKFRAPETVKVAVFEHLKSSKLNSRKKI